MSTFNPWWGCAKVSPACDNCYAEGTSNRWNFDTFGYEKRPAAAPRGYKPERKALRTFGDKHWMEPMRWDLAAKAAGERQRVFCGSMCDVFDEHPDAAALRIQLFELIQMTPHLDWLLLTKRAHLIESMLPDDWGAGYDNVWLGVTVENQHWAQKRLPYLLDIPARVRFLSVEPLLGAVDLRRVALEGGGYWDTLAGQKFAADSDPEETGRVHWVITGGESGLRARRTDPAWFDSLAGQCREAGTAFFFKQTGRVLAHELRLKHGKGEDISEVPERWRTQELPAGEDGEPLVPGVRAL